MRRKPLCAMPSRMSPTRRRCVSTLSEIDPGNSRKYGVTPYGTTGNTGTPSGSAASAATRSGRMQSTVSRRCECCSVLPSGSTARSSCCRYASTCIQFMSEMRTAIPRCTAERRPATFRPNRSPILPILSPRAGAFVNAARPSRDGGRIAKAFGGTVDGHPSTRGFFMSHKAAIYAAAVAATLAIGAGYTEISNAQAPAPAPRQGRGGNAGDSAAPARAQADGVGPFKKMVIRGVTLIDGTGGPPLSPMDIVIEGNRITAVRQAGWPGLPQQPNREPRDAEHEIDGKGMYVMPGFVDVHVHGAGKDKAPDLSYSYKLWLAHGVTTVRGVSLSSAATSSSEKNRSARNEIVAPRIFNYQTLGSGWSEGPVRSPEKAREWVRWAAANNIDGIKFFNRGDETPEIDAAAIDEAHRNKMGTVAHLSQNNVAMFNARQAGEAHLDTVTHYYGHFESLLKDKTIQDYPIGYDYNNAQDRFGDIARIWNQTYEPGSKEWVDYLEHQKANHVTFDPTFNIYAASRDLMRARNADWHQTYTMPQLWNYFQSTRDNHGSYFYDWTTENEVAWKNFYQRYMRLINDYKNMGGRVTVGTDSGFIWKTYGFAYIEELELLREAGFLPLEIIRSATMWGAKTLYEPRGEPAPMGVIRSGMLADLVIVGENPLSNLKVLYGTGHQRLNPQTNRQEKVGGVKYTIKDGIVYDAQKLLAEVAASVAAQKRTVTMTTAQP